MDRESTDFTLHVFRGLVCVRRTSKTTVCSALVMAPSRTSISLLGVVGSGRWHCSRVPRVLPAHDTPMDTPYAVVSSRGLLQGRRVLPLCHTATTRSGLMSTSVWQRVFACGRRIHVCLPSSADCQRRLGSTRERVHGACKCRRL